MYLILSPLFNILFFLAAVFKKKEKKVKLTSGWLHSIPHWRILFFLFYPSIVYGSPVSPSHTLNSYCTTANALHLTSLCKHWKFSFYFQFFYTGNTTEINSTSVSGLTLSETFKLKKYKVAMVEEISLLFYKLLAKLHIKLDKQRHAHTVIAPTMWWLMPPFLWKL